MNYSEMSDFDINKAVGEIILEGKWACKPGSAGNASDFWYYGSVDTFVTPYHALPDYCNSWADAGPIITQERISLIADGEWLAAGPGTGIDGYFDSKGGVGTYGGDLFWHDKNPVRAAMIVFLMMKEGEK